MKLPTKAFPTAKSSWTPITPSRNNPPARLGRLSGIKITLNSIITFGKLSTRKLGEQFAEHRRRRQPGRGPPASPPTVAGAPPSGAPAASARAIASARLSTPSPSSTFWSVSCLLGRPSTSELSIDCSVACASTTVLADEVGRLDDRPSAFGAVGTVTFESSMMAVAKQSSSLPPLSAIVHHGGRPQPHALLSVTYICSSRQECASSNLVHFLEKGHYFSIVVFSKDVFYADTNRVIYFS